MKKLFLFLIISLFSLQAFSQVNIETTRNKANKEGFLGELKGGLELQKGNVEKVKVDESLKKRQRVISNFKNSLGQLKRKIEKQDLLRIMEYL